MKSAPQLLLHWEPRWQEFPSSLAEALKTSPPKLASECGEYRLSGQSLSSSLGLHLILGIALMLTPVAMRQRVVLIPPNDPPLQITYSVGSYLPKVKDVAGSEAGSAGKAGGSHAFHPRQVIRVSMGRSAEGKNIDAPKLHIMDRQELANLIALAGSSAPAPPVAALKHELRKQRTLELPEVVQPALDAAKMRNNNMRVRAVLPEPVQPAPQVARDTLMISKLILPQQEVVPPPPDIAKIRLPRKFPEQELVSAVVPPSVQVEQISRTSNAFRDLPAQVTAIVAPAPELQQLAHSNPVPPIPGYAEAPSGPLRAPERVGDSMSTTSGRSRSDEKGSTGNQKVQAIVISAHPGDKVGGANSNGGSALVLSKTGDRDTGAGALGGGAGNTKGSGPGNDASDSGPGATSVGRGAGADLDARNGISNKPGPGGTGNGGDEAPSSGITIAGGTVHLGSFGAANLPATSPSSGRVLGPRRAPAITVVGSARSGGAMNRYGALKGGKIYTIYLQTRVGVAVLEYAEQPSTRQAFETDLTAPEPMESEIPADVHHSRMVVSCVIGADGALRDLHVLESAAADVSAKLVAALQGWRFRPVLRGDRAVTVNAILGFNIDTR